MKRAKKKSKTDIEWEKRTLCSDPACIGVIGPDGRCKECGKSLTGEPVEDSHVADDTPEPEAFEEEPSYSSVEEEEAAPSEEEETVTDPEWEKRTLCSDPACIGVIGPDNRCKECGQPYQGG